MFTTDLYENSKIEAFLKIVVPFIFLFPVECNRLNSEEETRRQICNNVNATREWMQ